METYTISILNYIFCCFADWTFCQVKEHPDTILAEVIIITVIELI